MSIVNRAKNLLTNPKQEWDVIAGETTSPIQLMVGYAIILAGLAAAMGIVGALVSASSMTDMMNEIDSSGAAAAQMSAQLATGTIIKNNIINFIVQMLIVFGMGFVVAALVPSFGGINDQTQGAKLIVYAGTGSWIGGIVGGALMMIPYLGWLLGLLVIFGGLFYSCYLIHLGLRPVMKVADDKLSSATVVTLVVYIGIAIVSHLILKQLGLV